MKNIVLAIAVLFVLIGIARGQQPVIDPAPKCATCANCQCGSCPTQCPLPQAQYQYQQPRQPQWTDTRGAWPWQGPFRWTGASGRWALGIRPRYQYQR